MSGYSNKSPRNSFNLTYMQTKFMLNLKDENSFVQCGLINVSSFGMTMENSGVMNSNQVGAMVSTLMQQGILVKSKCSRRKCILVELTPMGRTIYENMMSSYRKFGWRFLSTEIMA